MDTARRQRYRDKASLLHLRSGQVREWTRNLDAASFAADARTQLATYKALQEIVESAMDLCAMRLRDKGQVVKDDYTNIQTLEAFTDLDAEAARVLRESNGLRNRLVHAYEQIQDRLVMVFITQRLSTLVDRMEEAVRIWSAT